MTKARTDPFAAILAEGHRLFDARQFGAVEQICRQVLAQRSDHFEALNLLGLVAYTAHRYADAAALMGRALAQRRGEPHHYGNFGLALQAAGRLEEAVRAYRRALAGRPGEAAFHLNLGNALRDAGDAGEALGSFDRALALDPGLAGAHLGKALSLLSLGRIGEAWRHFEWRVMYADGRPYPRDPRDSGRDLPRPSELLPIEFRGRRALLLGEQGLGDELFFLRYAPRLKAQGAVLAYRGAPRLNGILSRIACLDAVIEELAPLPAADFTFLSGDLPLVTGAVGSEPPPDALELTVLAAQREAARRLLAAAGAAPYLAITWRAGNDPVAGRSRTLQKEVPLELLGRAIAGWRGTLVVVQRDPRPGEVDAFRRATRLPVADLSECNVDLELMLGLLESVEEYVGVSNTNMHLRAGLGRTARVLIPWPAEWRWTQERAESPWFPGFALYREERRAGWTSALERLARELGEGVRRSADR